MAVRFILNGKPVRVDDVDPHLTLLNWLRASGRTGTKEGCSEGECGACAVAIVRGDDRGGGGRYQAINSCLVPLPAMDGHTLVTVEGVAEPSGALHPVQRLLVERGGSQCGYCTPGFVVSLFCEYHRPGRTDFDPESISGNLCRCTGYRPILDAGRALGAPTADDPHQVAHLGPVAAPGAVDHTGAGRRFVRPGHLDEVFALLAETASAGGAATLIAGGTDLMVRANQAYERFPTLVSLEAVAELRQFAVRPAEIVIGAALTLSELEERIAGTDTGDDGAPTVPLLQELLRLFSSRLIRNRATLGGNLVTASPIGDGLPALLALDAELTLASPRGRRRLPLRQFFTGYRATALGPHELVVSVHLPRPLPTVQRFYKVSKRLLDDISTVAGAFALTLTDDGHVESLRAAYGGIAATPIAATAVEDLARGRRWDGDTLTRLCAEVETLGTPMSDHRGSARYRRAMTVSLLRKFFSETAPPGGVAA